MIEERIKELEKQLNAFQKELNELKNILSSEKKKESNLYFKSFIDSCFSLEENKNSDIIIVSGFDGLIEERNLNNLYKKIVWDNSPISPIKKHPEDLDNFVKKFIETYECRGIDVFEVVNDGIMSDWWTGIVAVTKNYEIIDFIINNYGEVLGDNNWKEIIEKL